MVALASRRGQGMLREKARPVSFASTSYLLVRIWPLVHAAMRGSAAVRIWLVVDPDNDRLDPKKPLSSQFAWQLKTVDGQRRLCVIRPSCWSQKKTIGLDLNAISRVPMVAPGPPFIKYPHLFLSEASSSPLAPLSLPIQYNRWGQRILRC